MVLNPKTREVRRLIVRKGLLFPEDKNVTLHLITPAAEDRVSLSEDAGDLDKLPQLEETPFIPVDAGELLCQEVQNGNASAVGRQNQPSF